GDEVHRYATAPAALAALRIRQGARAAALARARTRRESERSALDRAQERVHLGGRLNGGEVARENAVAVIPVQRPVAEVQRLHWNARVVGGRRRIAALDEVHHVGEPLPLRTGSRRVEVAAGVASPEL